MTTDVRTTQRAYPAYKDSGIEWLGEIPEHWEVVKFRYCCSITEGQIDPTLPEYSERILIAPNHIESGTGRILFTETALEQGASSGKYLVTPGDIVYSKIRPALNKVCIAKGDWLCSADMYPIRIDKRLERSFLLFFMLSDQFVNLMVDESMRVAMPKVNRETLAACPIICPPLPEQEAIARFLDHKTAQIDALIAKKEALLARLADKRTALISQAVTQGLDPTVPMRDSGIEWLGEIPAHWALLQFRRFSHLSQGLQIPQSERFYDSDEERVEYITVRSIHAGVGGQKEYILKPPKRVLCRKEDILMSRTGATGQVITGVEGAFHNNFFKVEYDQNLVHKEFYIFFLSSIQVQRQLLLKAGTTTIPDLNHDDYLSTYISLPPFAEQIQISVFLSNAVQKINVTIDKIQSAIDKLKQYRTALITNAVTGKIDVREAGAWATQAPTSL